MMKKLTGKWALVTGSSRGIGRQIAVGLGRLGCNVYVHGRKIEHTEATVSQLETLGVETTAVAAELSSEDEIAALTDAIIKKTGGVDILYNNAAVMSAWGAVWEIPEEEWKRVFRINLYAVVRLCNVFAPIMKKRGYGRIVNLTSGIKDQPELAPYSVSKAAVDKYSKDIAFELKDDNVLVNLLDPGWLRTDLGGPDAWFDVETVLPGALVPALLEDNGPTGELFQAQRYKYLAS
ncbi:MAG: SDR family oxidoreductase [Spirochaetales bacterium]|nr:SDR family oxidoreductase [Spirochaetales bacterium]